jgi:hypothetical protein
VSSRENVAARRAAGIMPFNYRLGVDGKLVTHEAEQEAIREMASAQRPRTLVK